MLTRCRRVEADETPLHLHIGDHNVSTYVSCIVLHESTFVVEKSPYDGIKAAAFSGRRWLEFYSAGEFLSHKLEGSWKTGLDNEELHQQRERESTRIFRLLLSCDFVLLFCTAKLQFDLSVE
ncbi:hypothetical protein J6590_000416 [Homalodisca vitripennis]|nr:hypothetical protein J6590_000416 [Homalodisca vitripennis]